MTEHFKLFIPGPGEVPDDVLDAMGQPVMRHYGVEWMEVYNETVALLKQAFQTQNDLYIVPGPGSAAMDMAFGSLLAAGQKIIVGMNGYFGDRLYHIGESYGLQVVPVTAPLGQPVSPGDLRQALREHPDALAVAVVHHETGTTVMNPLRELAQVTKEAGRALIVDAVSSLGGVDVPVDAWGIDVCVTAANKCLECPPGLALISISPLAWELVDKNTATGHGWYLNLKTWRKYATEWAGWHPYPVTLPTNNILALRTSLRHIFSQGLESHWAKHARAARAVREGLRNLGVEMFVPDEYASPIATAVLARPEFPVADLLHWLADEHGIVVGGGLAELSGKIFRVGHLGKANTREYLLDFIFAVEDFLRLKGIPVPLGAGLIGLEPDVLRK